MPFISIIIPNYNHAPYLTERIESVLNQTYQNFEVINLDDCSTDNSKEIIEKYRNHHKISHIIFNEQNSGSTFKQWEKGIMLAKGEYIWVAESDDVADNFFLEKMISVLEKDSEISIAYCKSIKIDENGKTLGLVKWGSQLDNTKWEKSFINDGNKEIDQYFRYFCIITNASSAIFRKNKINYKIFTYISKMKFAGDWLFWLHLIQNNKIGFLAEPLNYFRFHNNSTRSTKSLEIEKKRYEELAYIIKYTSKICKSKIVAHNYFWILQEWKLRMVNHKKQNKFRILCYDFPLKLNFFFLKQLLKK